VLALAKAVTDKDGSVSIAAANALAAIGPDAFEAVGALQEVMNEQKDGNVRGAAANALWKIQADGK